MRFQFTADDRQAIDLALRQPGEQQGFVKSAGPSLRQRVRCIERVLGLLAHLPAPPPRPGLVQRTLKHIEAGPKAANPAPQAHAGLRGQGRCAAALCAPALAQTFRLTQAKYPPS